MARRWTEARIARVRSMVARNRPTAEIARALGVSRNAIIGLCHRNGIGLGRGETPARSGRRSTATDEASLSSAAPRGLSRRQRAAWAIDAAGPGCLYPTGCIDDGDLRFCGAGRQDESPYCPRHHAVCYTRINVREAAE